MTMKELETRLALLEAAVFAMAAAAGHGGVVNDAMSPAESDETLDDAPAQTESIASE